MKKREKLPSPPPLSTLLGTEKLEKDDQHWGKGLGQAVLGVAFYILLLVAMIFFVSFLLTLV